MDIDGGLRRRMQLALGVQEVRAAQGDPLAIVLRGGEVDPAWPPVTRSTTGGLLVTGYDAAVSALSDPALVPDLIDWRPDGVPAMTPAETGLAALLIDRSTPRPADERGRTARWQHLCARLLDGVPDGADLAGIAARLSVAMTADLLGLSPATADRLAARQPDTAGVLDDLLRPPGVQRARRTAEAVAEAASIVGGRPTDLLLVVIGARITTVLLLNALTVAGGDGLRPGPATAPAVIAETLRHQPPVRIQMLDARAATAVAGEPVPAGTQVAVHLAAANRDSAVFTDPDRFDPARPGTPATLLPARPVDVVLPIAREQAAAALTAMSARFSGASLGPALRQPDAPVTGAVVSLPIRTAVPVAGRSLS